jgi:5-methyltetrahydrofolate--homocysteine methyltransferase
MAKSDLLQRLQQGVILGDGAMGTQLQQRGLQAGSCGEMLNLEQPKAIQAIHRDYLQAGSRLITTNTFGGSETTLERHGLAERTTEINIAGAEVALKAVQNEDVEAWVMGNLGPFGDFVEPYGDTEEDELLEIFAKQVAALAQGGADALLIETMTDATEASIAVKACMREGGGRPVLATFAFDKTADGGFRTMMGQSVADCLGAVKQAGASIIGANCGTSLGLSDYERLAQEVLEAADGGPTILQPNAGAPQVGPEGQAVYAATPEQMAQLAQRLAQLGINVIGGCCGTTPELLRAMGEALRPQSA